MRELSQSPEGPSLFDAPPPHSYTQAKDFVKWCCSFGPEFRNSPDASNLRYWAHKNKIKIDLPEERDILDSAREIYLKRIEQHVREAGRAEAPN
jgi:hypothetical protein